MIEIYEGRLGGGKTYSAVVRMVDHLRKGGTVCTNVALKWESVSRYVADNYGVVVELEQLIVLTDEQIAVFHRHTPSGDASLNVLVVIDEAHLVFNARDWANTSRETLAFLTQSRKVKTDVIFISQSALNIDKQFGRLVQFIWRFRDLEKWRIPGLGIGWPLKQILCCQFDYDGKTILQRNFIAKDKRVFTLYDTNSLLREFPRLEVAKASRTLAKSSNPNKHKMIRLLILVIVAGLIAAFYTVRKFNKEPEKKVVVSATVEPTKSAPFVAPSAAKVTDEMVPKAAVIAAMEAARADERARVKDTKGADMYKLHDEAFRSWDANSKALRTDAGFYALGEMSNKGFVVGVGERSARAVAPDGMAVWVVARDGVKVIQGNPPAGEVAKSETLAADYGEDLSAQDRTRGGWPTKEQREAVAGVVTSPKSGSQKQAGEVPRYQQAGVIRGNRLFRISQPPIQ